MNPHKQSQKLNRSYILCKCLMRDNSYSSTFLIRLNKKWTCCTITTTTMSSSLNPHVALYIPENAPVLRESPPPNSCLITDCKVCLQRLHEWGYRGARDCMERVGQKTGKQNGLTHKPGQCHTSHFWCHLQINSISVLNWLKITSPNTAHRGKVRLSWTHS